MKKRKLLFVGPVLTGSGYGVHARQLLKALADTGEFDIAVESLRWGETPFLQDASLEWIRGLTAKKHATPDLCVEVTIPSEFKRRAAITIGVTAGIETDRVSPDWILKCNQEVDAIVVPSEHSRRGFLVEYQASDGSKLRLEKPIFVIPEGVDTGVYKSAAVSSGLLDELVVPDRNFIFVGLGLDKPQGRDRKNVSSLIEWFCRAFAGNPNVGLILKTAIVNASTVDYEITRKRIEDIKKSTGCGEFPKVFLVHGRLEDYELSAMYNDPRIVAAVSVTHGEGFGLPLIEAAACGLPVVATDWSGHLDFLTKAGRKLFIPVEYDLREIYPESANQWMIEGTQWAVPRESDFITKLQKLLVSSVTPRKWAEELGAHIHEKYSLSATGALFADFIRQAAAQVQNQPTSREEFTQALRSKVREGGPSLVYTMPMSAGDVFLSTSVVKALRQRHPGHRVYFATSAQYFPLARTVADELIEWQPWMQDVSLLEDVFDEVYTPNLAVQMAWSNWVHRGRGRNLLDEFAVQCGVDPSKLEEPVIPTDPSPIDPEMFWSSRGSGQWVCVHAGGQKSARLYAHWGELVKNIRSAGIKVMQVGAADDVSIGEVDEDARGQFSFGHLAQVLGSCGMFLGIDSFPMHLAAAAGSRVIAIFGSSYGSTTGPKNFRAKVLTDLDMLVNDVVSRSEKLREFRRLTVIETPDRNGCDRACYKDVCKVDSSNPCINNVPPQQVYYSLLEKLGIPSSKHEYKEHRPKIAGYTHILNPKTHGYPYVESIKSMLGFCDEVIVVDGGSTDGSLEEFDNDPDFMRFKHHGILKVITREWDHDEPGMDGMQKAFGRAMVSPDVEFLWQQDADEIVHEADYHKIVDLCKRFPSDVDVVHLPVIELWGDDRTVRTDRHSWKWRLSRNNLRVTHGINSKARQLDPKTGRFYAKKGMSDGCEYIDMVSGEHLPHRGFYDANLDRIRQEDPDEYGKRMNEIFKRLPSVWHYSWADLPRKIRNFRDFWDKQWQVLYQTPAEPRFPDVVTDADVETAAGRLKTQGGEHGPAPTFKIDMEPPEVMR